jgi:hypothetical protein
MPHGGLNAVKGQKASMKFWGSQDSNPLKTSCVIEAACSIKA